MSKLLQGKRASFVAGHKEMELTEAARDTQGRLWPIGTVYQPSSAGYNGETDRDEHKVAKAVMSAEEWSAKKFALILEREQADLAARLVTHTHPLPGQAEDLARAEWWARDRSRYNGETDRDEQTVHIKGETVVFAGPVRS